MTKPNHHRCENCAGILPAGGVCPCDPAQRIHAAPAGECTHPACGCIGYCNRPRARAHTSAHTSARKE